ncbi:uncharacterized protein N7483_011767 [Penicillium malachiteum]|uniref:uncharacterized protein n=1 Tax=Penicillium malachiteum TaxID=1324776 RepID=UPI002547E698|nr:uncharacterized protein N7483_011767 [Penicillium malachiteum]KAJ5714586.1 hypothetical protein N7483_011767 [Penicillium malachiteum]
MILLADRTDSVKVAAIRTLTQLLEMVQVVSPVNAYLFPEYIFPRLQHFVISSKSNPSAMVRAAYASCIASLAHSSLRFLDMIQALRSDARLTTMLPVGFEPRWTEDATYHNLYDVARVDLLEYFEVHTKALLTDTDASVRRAFLGSVSRLCVFFGNLKANEVILSHLNTYLNDRDWILKCAFFETVVGVAAYVGSTSVEQYILPLMIPSMTEPEEFVVERVIRCLAAMADFGLFQRSTTWDLLHITIGFLAHPSVWIREATVDLVVKSTKFLSMADIYSILTPLIRPFLRVKIVGFSKVEVLSALKRPMSKSLYDLAFLWAEESYQAEKKPLESNQPEKGIFWPSADRDGAFSLSEPGIHHLRPGRSFSLGSQLKNEKDEQWLVRMRNMGMGMGSDDEVKLVALKGYIWRLTLRKGVKDKSPRPTPPSNNIISLSEKEITPQNVFFNDRPQNISRDQNESHKPAGLKPRTIADALLDASTTIERGSNPHLNHLRSRSQIHRETELTRLGRAGDIGVDSSSSSPAASSPAAGPSSRPLSPPVSDGHNTDRRLSSGHESSSTTPTNTDNLSLKGGLDRVQRKSSAINLLGRNDTTKAFAETSTSAANAFGKVDAPVQRAGTPQSSALTQAYERKPASATAAAAATTTRRYRGNHSYAGDDPVVLRLLDNVFAENYPTDLFDMGPFVKELDSRQPIRKANTHDPNKIWRPEGNLVATFGEHSGPVNRISVPPDHSFFVTASDDSTVKIWDTTRLERNLTPRSRQTHRHAAGARVKALTFVEDTYTFVSGATDGSIHAVRVDYQKVNENARYGKLQLVREYHLPVTVNGAPEYAVWMEHFRDEGQSTLLIATNTCRILALDMKTMLPIFTLENPVHHGTPTTFCCDRRHTWLLVGTTHGVLDLWDLRFRVRVKAWGLPGWGSIQRIYLHPTKPRGRWVCVSSSGSHGNEITVWDIEKFRCREVYQATPLNNKEESSNGNHRGSRGVNNRLHRATARDFEAWPVDEDRPEGMLTRFATATPAAGGLPTGEIGSASPPNAPSGDRLGTWAFTVGLNAPGDDKTSNRCGFIVSAGSDRKIRFWDLAHPELSTIVSGSEMTPDGTIADKPNYDISQPGPNLTVVSEQFPSPSGNGNNTPAKGSKKGTNARPPRSTVISLQQQMLLKSHLDIIQDVVVLRQPYGMIVSVDRAGMVYIFR